MALPAVSIRIGERVRFQGRSFVLLGHEPMSVPDRRADVVDPATGRRYLVPLDELRPLELRPFDPGPEGFSPAA